MAKFQQRLFILLLIIQSYNAVYNPEPRMMHSASLIKNKLYVIGGASTDILNDTFYLDLSLNFTLDNSPFINDITTPNLAISIDNMAYATGGKDNNIIFLFGGWEGEVRFFYNIYT